MKKYFSILIIVFTLGFYGCSSTPHLPSYVCEYTNIVCEYSDLVCQVYPQSCWYVQVACNNLQMLCDSTLTDQEKNGIAKTMQLNNELMKKFLSQKNEGIK